jgi:Rrf2 family protein
MRISTKGRYGLRAMVELARNYGNGPLEMRVITERQKIPRKYLHALLTSLRTAGLVRSLRGSRGGYALARPPAEISAHDVILALEGPIVLVDCRERGSECELRDACVTRGLWQELSRMIEKRLVAVSLADLAREKRPTRAG